MLERDLENGSFATLNMHSMNRESEREMEREKSPSVSALLLIISNSVVNNESFTYHHYLRGTEPVCSAQGHCGLRPDYVCSSAASPTTLF